jgi:hypothetical protein
MIRRKLARRIPAKSFFPDKPEWQRARLLVRELNKLRNKHRISANILY